MKRWPPRAFPPELSGYYGELSSRVSSEYSLASQVRARTAAPTSVVEVALVADMAERVEALVGPSGVAELIRELQGSHGSENLPFRLARELLPRVGELSDEALGQVLKTSLAVMTPPCITAAPSEGISGVRIKQNTDGSRYLAVYFAGPIRSAGGTEIAGAVVLADYIRRLAGLDRYKPGEGDVRRFIEELRLYRRRVARFQYRVPDDVIEYVLWRLPIEITGVATDMIPVPAYRDAWGAETPYIRGGALRVVNDGIAGRAKKVLRIVEMSGLDGWEWLREVPEMLKRGGGGAGSGWLEEVVGGRPVLSMPGRMGGFRLRYGRAPTTGMAALGVHPYSMRLLGDFVVAGTQLRVDYPGKGGVAVPIDAVEPPVVLLGDGSVIRVDSEEKLAEAERAGVKILFNGDLLVSFGDCVENNVRLRPPGYCEEWWVAEAQLALARGGSIDRRDMEEVERAARSPTQSAPPVEAACRVSHRLRVPIHPRYMPFWDAAHGRDVEKLRRWVSSSLREAPRQGGMILLDYDASVKAVLEGMLIEHRVVDHRIGLKAEALKSLIYLFRPFKQMDVSGMGIEEAVEALSGTPYRPRMGSIVAARVGRPEKAGQRRMRPPTHVLFPIGLAGGPKRNIAEAAAKAGVVVLDLVRRVCLECGEKTWESRCRVCGATTVISPQCVRCGAEYAEVVAGRCPRCGGELSASRKQVVGIKELYESALRLASEPPLALLKGVRGLSSRVRQPEELVKGVLRASLGLYVYKDGTVRFDATNAPLTHFKPAQIGVSVEALRLLGYTHDVYGQPLVSDDQVCELRIQDIVVPRRLAEHLFRVSRFIDRYLRVLGMEEHYRLSGPDDVVGLLVAVLSPHTYGAVACRVIGFTDANVVYAHPVLHGAKRRDCDGDEDSVMLLLDVLINFSRQYLPDRIGGAMDSPLLLTVAVYPWEVDEQAHNVDAAWRYPLAFYQAASKREGAASVSGIVPLIKDHLGSSLCYHGLGYTVPASSLVGPSTDSTYKRLRTMLDKVEAQLRLAERLLAVDERVVAERVIDTHILPDIMGNMRTFFSQSFLCRRCGSKYRRPPLSGRCSLCGGEVSQSLYRGAIEKYIELAEDLLERYIDDPYLREGGLAAIENIHSVFGAPRRRDEKQTTLRRFM